MPHENSLSDHEKQHSPLDIEKDALKQGEITSAHDSDINFGVLDSERDIATNIITVHDDPTLNTWTLRAFVLGFGLSAFGGVLGKSLFAFVFSSAASIGNLWSAEIYYFKPVWTCIIVFFRRPADFKHKL